MVSPAAVLRGRSRGDELGLPSCPGHERGRHRRDLRLDRRRRDPHLLHPEDRQLRARRPVHARGLLRVLRHRVWGRSGAGCGQPIAGCRGDRRHQRAAVQLVRLRFRGGARRRRRRPRGANFLAGARHGRAAEHPCLRHRDPRRHGLGGRQHHRGPPARRVRESLHGLLPGSDTSVRLHERVRRVGVDGVPDLPAAGPLRSSPSANGVSRVRGLPIAIVLAAAALALANAGRLNPYWTHVAIIAMYYGILAASWSLLAGYVGLFSLSHMAFASIGGYTSALLIQWFRLPIPLGIVAGVVMCCALGGAIGWVCLRMSGPYLAIFTLGFSEIVVITL